MAFTLLSDLQGISNDKLLAEAEVLLESVDKFLGNIFAVLKNHKDPFGEGKLKVEDVAAYITGLQVLGKSANRAGFDDLGTNEGFLNFLSDLGESSAGKKFDDDHFTATDFLKHIGAERAKTVYEKNLQKVKAFADPSGDKKAKESFLADIGKINIFYQKALQTLKNAQSKNKQAAATSKSGNMTAEPELKTA